MIDNDGSSHLEVFLKIAAVVKLANSLKDICEGVELELLHRYFLRILLEL